MDVPRRETLQETGAAKLESGIPLPCFPELEDIKPASLAPNAVKILRERFLLDKEESRQETPEEMMNRVADMLAREEHQEHYGYWRKIFFNVMAGLLFHPGSRVLANGGTANPQLANCFVLPLEDDRHAILKSFTEACDIKSNGGGCGFNYSKIRPKEDKVREHKGLACGPTAFLKLFDEASNIFRQKGRYESGNMAIINVDHPDVREFISAKEQDGSLRLTNISVGITDDFMHAVANNDTWRFIHPSTKKTVRKISARDLFRDICVQAWKTGDPGLIFLDRINRDNPLLKSKGAIDATNTCGEIALFPYESCNLGYLNLEMFLSGSKEPDVKEIFDLQLLKSVVRVAIRMIDNTISCSWYPIEAINQSVRENRRVGLGVTGWADCLSICGIPYDSEIAFQLGEELACTIRKFAEEASESLALEKSPYPNAIHSTQKSKRNIALLALPPSGNNALIFDNSFSIEPHFSLSYSERVMGDQIIRHKNRHLVAALAEGEYDIESIFRKIEHHKGSIQTIAELPQSLRDCFKTALEISPQAHIRMQAAFQKYVDNAVTKTVNLPDTSTPEDVAIAFKYAWELDCKGITIYCDGSKKDQVIEYTNKNIKIESKANICEECADIFQGQND